MAELRKYPDAGCGPITGIFKRWSYWQRKSSVPFLPAKSSNGVVSKPRSKPQQKSVETARHESSNLAKPSKKQEEKLTRKANLVEPRISTTFRHEGHSHRRLSDAARSSSSSSSSSVQQRMQRTHDSPNEQKLKKESPGGSAELTRMMNTNDHHQHSNDKKALVRVTSSHIMLLGNLNTNCPSSTPKTVDYLQKNTQQVTSCMSKPRYGHSIPGINGVMGNIIRQPSDEFQQCRGLMSRLDPETLKKMGNEAYKQGRFQEALDFYERAIALDSKKAAYRSNKSAALIGLGRLTEAVFECKQAIQLDPTYQRAHHRLATLYIRLGEAEGAIHHYKQAGKLSDRTDISHARDLQERLIKCNEARKLNEWNILLKETKSAIYSGADSAPQIYALQAEALLKLHRHQEAYESYLKAPNISIEIYIKLFGLAVSSYILMIEAEVYMAAGRFDDAVAAAQQAVRIDPSNREVNTVVKKTRAVASARLSGNLLFKASKFSEACIVYSEGLEHGPYNSVLLCNRAACRWKLGQFEKAIEDCTAALEVQACYSKARLRRADCNAKLGRWEAAIQDYEMLIRESPGDEEVGRALFDARVQLKKLRGEDVKDMKFGFNMVSISSNERFRHFVTSPGGDRRSSIFGKIRGCELRPILQDIQKWISSQRNSWQQP
ncbi:inactive TPR repeat-containing thioredoxin TTL3-like isoform X2 [Carica papaya]|uniref:inactive TPR repeat-containing thioredoxin TTL3-like isoform X2 n=1 Tax=Carica papaya TaxID=3649 RepID=UPI000B8C8777|nr:inactive TPR repeat-containing thioredoxin TTL3-like isoform X2 [Carica papaya]